MTAGTLRSFEMGDLNDVADACDDIKAIRGIRLAGFAKQDIGRRSGTWQRKRSFTKIDKGANIGRLKMAFGHHETQRGETDAK